MTAADTTDHALSHFLSERLPLLGLDYETYGPYVEALFTLNDRDLSSEHQDIVDDEEWDSVMQLLQASSESHSDQDEVWETLRRDIRAAWQEEWHHRQALEAQRRHEQHVQLEETIAREKEEARQIAEHKQQQQQQQQKSEAPHADTKHAILSRFAYEHDGSDDDEAPESETFVSNQQVAAQAAQERTQALKKVSVTTKKEEQQKTAQAKQDKVQAKEERRKRATKGERRR
jgi:hypothetical protein